MLYKIFSLISCEILIPHDRVLMQFSQGDCVFLMHLETAYPDKCRIFGHTRYLDMFEDVIFNKHANFS